MIWQENNLHDDAHRPTSQAIPVKLFANPKAPCAMSGTEIRRLADGALDLKRLAVLLSADSVRVRVPHIINYYDDLMCVSRL